MTTIGHIFRISIPSLLAFSTLAVAQVPAGVPYDAKKHPNPIVTWVNEKDFQKSSFLEAAEKAGVELMSLSKEEGERTAVQIAVPATSRVKLRLVQDEFEVTFYPVVRQNYKLKSGKMLQLYTFRFPRALTTADVLNRAAFQKPPRGVLPRFGELTLPERMDIRDVPGLYFDDGKLRTIYWFELNAGYSITTDADKDELFKVLDDLL
jgi:hypothetical protein